MNKEDVYVGRENVIAIMALPVIASLVIFYYNQILGSVAIILTIVLFFFLRNINRKKKDDFQNYVDEMNVSFDIITKNVVFEMPFPIAIVEDDRTIKWHNTYFRDLFDNKSIVGSDIEKFLPDFYDVDFKEDGMSLPRNISIDDKILQFYYQTITNEENGKTQTFLYGIDNTYDESIKQLFKDKRLVFYSVFIDNYEDIRNSTESVERPQVLGEIDRVINEYFKKYNCLIRKYENDRYMVISEYQDYRNIYETKFSILDGVRNIEKGNTLPPTLSIGVGIAGANPTDIYSDSREAVDIALSRGGDQAVVKLEDNYEYFGGKTRAIEKTSKVRSRVISQALRRMIQSSPDIFIMGHNNPDMDSFGSSLGVYEGTLDMGKEVYIVLNEVTRPIENMYDRVTTELSELKENILTESEALSKISPQSLIIVTDNHRKNSTEAPALLDKSDNIFIIDHHRRGKDYIENATISYIEPYASSASELVTEILSYLDEDFKARTPIAESLLAGITVDTKNFVYQTGVRTFEAASILKRWGADSVYIKRMFKDDFEIVKYKSEVIADSFIVNDFIAIAHFKRDIDGSTLIASQAADDLLNIKGVKASFVLTISNNKIHISGRSLGDISVQLILERIGGGGHLTAAATQLDMTMENAEDMLRKAINEYLREEEENESNTNR
ncbi:MULTISPECIES: DHH family phosphoesterase [Anaerococcus]|uniref:DHH family phosphoesterase n=1 Tax=Anaerococcus TaxID=165779 RepID=UPI0027B89182|nr:MULTISPECIES: DHH family phosphoesterase [Anaerococcus]MDU2558132.1 DHH family phosphoesterase [Anaerococcus prevotii]MDU2584396.1 DHH family phosphoesterase [Anaerococcus prevotii]MDU3136548.1 DHH family phosphoesterase [Anaerococcus prevotii]